MLCRWQRTTVVSIFILGVPRRYTSFKLEMATTATIITSYTAAKQTAEALNRNSVSLIIEYSRRQVARCFEKGIDVDRRIPWQYEVARLPKKPRKKITGLPCYHCHDWIKIGDPYFRKRSNHNTKIYCMNCTNRLGYLT